MASAAASAASGDNRGSKRGFIKIDQSRLKKTFMKEMIQNRIKKSEQLNFNSDNVDTRSDVSSVSAGAKSDTYRNIELDGNFDPDVNVDVS